MGCNSLVPRLPPARAPRVQGPARAPCVQGEPGNEARDAISVFHIEESDCNHHNVALYDITMESGHMRVM